MRPAKCRAPMAVACAFRGCKYAYIYAYLSLMRISWDESKRRSNLRKHGFDFADAEVAFSGITYTVEDKRFPYGEQRFVTLGLVRHTVVVVAHTETRGNVRVISMRKANRHEQTIYYENI